jgi:integrase
MSTIKPKAEWRVGMSIFAESTGLGQIRWLGDDRDDQSRLQVVFIRNKRSPDKFYRSAVVRGSAAEAVKVLERFREEFEASQPKAAPAAAVRVPRSRRKHPNTVLTGHANSERHWKQQYDALVAEAPPRPPAPAGLPPLKPRIRMRSGRVVETSSPVWKVHRDFTTDRRIILNIDRLYRPWALGVKNPGGLLGGIPRRESSFSVELKHAVSLFVARTLERRTGGQAFRILAELIQFEAFLAAQNPEQVFGPSELSERVYRAFARTPATVRGHFVAFYRWCVGQGFAGFDIQVLMRLRRVPIHSGVRGKAIRSSDPRKGALAWEEQQLLTRALAAPAPQTHPRDRLIVWLFQELGARPSAIGALRNQHLQATPLGDAYILHVPRVKQSGPTRDLIPRKISKGLGDLIRSLRVGGDDESLIPGHLEYSWATKACRAFVAANALRSPRLVAHDAGGVEQPEPLPLNAYRLRYTMGTNLAEQGASPEQIAAMLDDRTLAMALVYTHNTSELVDALEETLDRHPAWLRQMHLFLGKVGTSENRRLPVIQGAVPYFENYERYAERVNEIGWCSNPQPCELRPPLSCYRCGWFVAHPDPGVHLQQLDQLKDEVRTKVGVESDRMAKVLRPDMFAIAELVTMTRGGATAGQRIETRIALEGAARGAGAPIARRQRNERLAGRRVSGGAQEREDMPAREGSITARQGGEAEIADEEGAVR